MAEVMADSSSSTPVSGNVTVNVGVLSQAIAVALQDFSSQTTQYRPFRDTAADSPTTNMSVNLQ
jgi:hypothetical protein